MARHRTVEERQALGEQARALSAAGVARPDIRRQLGIGSATLQELLLEGRTAASRRSWAVGDDRRARAVELRLAGRTYPEIAAELGVSRSTCSLWLRHLPQPASDPERRAAIEERRLEALRDRARRDRVERDQSREATAAAAASRVGDVSSRDLVLAAAVAYWCEGTKRKPWRRNVTVQFMNSDPVLVLLFLEGIALLGVRREQLDFRLHIHESADEAAARAWWMQVVGHPPERFSRSTIKRHNPLTPRCNVDEGYRGCVCITVRDSGALYDVLAGVVTGLTRNGVAAQEWQDADQDRSEREHFDDVPSAVG